MKCNRVAHRCVNWLTTRSEPAATIATGSTNGPYHVTAPSERRSPPFHNLGAKYLDIFACRYVCFSFNHTPIERNASCLVDNNLVELNMQIVLCALSIPFLQHPSALQEQILEGPLDLPDYLRLFFSPEEREQTFFTIDTLPIPDRSELESESTPLSTPLARAGGWFSACVLWLRSCSSCQLSILLISCCAISASCLGTLKRPSPKVLSARQTSSTKVSPPCKR